MGIEMGEVGESFLSPQPPVPLFAVGDMVQVFEGTGVGKEGLRNVGWFGKVVGREGDAFLVRNRLLAAKGRANLVQGEFMKLQVDFGITSLLLCLIFLCLVLLVLVLSSVVTYLLVSCLQRPKRVLNTNSN